MLHLRVDTSIFGKAPEKPLLQLSLVFSCLWSLKCLLLANKHQTLKREKEPKAKQKLNTLVQVVGAFKQHGGIRGDVGRK